MIVRERRNVAVNLRFSVSENEQGEAPFIGIELCPLLATPAQIKCTIRLVAINAQQLRTFSDLLLPS